MTQSACFKQTEISHRNFSNRNYDREKHCIERRSESIKRKLNTHTETVVRKIPAVYKTGT